MVCSGKGSLGGEAGRKCVRVTPCASSEEDRVRFAVRPLSSDLVS
jgi:hypothetical protein